MQTNAQPLNHETYLKEILPKTTPQQLVNTLQLLPILKNRIKTIDSIIKLQKELIKYREKSINELKIENDKLKDKNTTLTILTNTLMSNGFSKQ